MIKNISIREYNDLHEADQHEAIWQHGCMMGKRIEGGYEVIQYSLFGFYVELYYDILHNILKQLKSFPKKEYKKFKVFSPLLLTCEENLIQ